MVKYILIFFILILIISYLKPSSSYKFAVPVNGRISNGYGYRVHPVSKKLKFHRGIDIKAKKGKKVMAAAEGHIVAAAWSNSYGNFIKIQHRNNFLTIYAHLSKILVKKGQTVRKGQVIGKVGSTGISTGNHLHFEIKYKNKNLNPLLYLPLKFIKKAFF